VVSTSAAVLSTVAGVAMIGLAARDVFDALRAAGRSPG
jgi:hypothetical protein